MAAGITREIIDGGNVRLDPQFSLMSGIDDSDAPQLVRVNAAGGLVGSGGFSLPEYDRFYTTRIGSTNNIGTIVYLKNDVIVATLTVTYVNGGALDNDDVEAVVQS